MKENKVITRVDFLEAVRWRYTAHGDAARCVKEAEETALKSIVQGAETDALSADHSGGTTLEGDVRCQSMRPWLRERPWLHSGQFQTDP